MNQKASSAPPLPAYRRRRHGHGLFLCHRSPRRGAGWCTGAFISHHTHIIINMRPSCCYPHGQRPHPAAAVICRAKLTRLLRTGYALDTPITSTAQEASAPPLLGLLAEGHQIPLSSVELCLQFSLNGLGTVVVVGGGDGWSGWPARCARCGTQWHDAVGELPPRSPSWWCAHPWYRPQR